MYKSITLLIFLFAQCSLFGQYEIIKYNFSDNYKTDQNFQKFEKRLNNLIEEVNILRDTIIYTKRVPEQDKLYALQLVNMFFADPGEVHTIMIRNGELFPWFQYKSPDEVKKLVDDFCTYFFFCDLIRNSYDDVESNIFVQHMRNDVKSAKRIIKSLGLHKNKERQSIWFRNQINDLGLDKFLYNKDIYFTTYFYSTLDKWAWSNQIYANKNLSKRGNEYFNIMKNDSVFVSTTSFDYIIQVTPNNSMDSFESTIKMLKDGGRLYLELDYLTEAEYHIRLKERNDFNEKHKEFQIQTPRSHFTRDSLKKIVSDHGLHIEKEDEDGELVKYVLRKM